MASPAYEALLKEAAEFLGHIDEVIQASHKDSLVSPEERDALDHMRALMETALVFLQVGDPNGLMAPLAKICNVLWTQGAEKIGWLGEVP